MTIDQFLKIHNERLKTAVCWYFFDSEYKLPYRLRDIREDGDKLIVDVEYPTALQETWEFKDKQIGFSRLIYESTNHDKDDGKGYSEFVKYWKQLSSGFDCKNFKSYLKSIDKILSKL